MAKLTYISGEPGCRHAWKWRRRFMGWEQPATDGSGIFFFVFCILRWIRYGILIVGVQKDSRAFTPRLWTRLLKRRNRPTNCVRAKKFENRLFFYWTWSPIIATTHSLMQIKVTIRIHAKIKYQRRVINACTKYFKQKCTFLSVFTRMVSSHANLLT